MTSEGRKAFFYTDDEGRARFAGGPSSGGGGAVQAAAQKPRSEEDQWNNARRFYGDSPDEIDGYGRNAFEESAKGLNATDAAALTLYSSDAFEEINGTLRGKYFEETDSIFLEAKRRLGDEFYWALPDSKSELRKKVVRGVIGEIDAALDKTKIPEDMVAWRGVSSDYFLKALKPGDVVVDRAYVSTSINEKKAKVFGNNLVEIRIPAGHKGLYLDGMSESDWEAEVLLPRNTSFRLIGSTSIPGGSHYVMEVVP